MDKGKNVQAIISATMLLVLLCAGQASASFNACFFGCVANCMYHPDRVKCSGKCLIKCIFHPKALGIDYCKQDCALHQCVRLITDDFKLEDVVKVVSCVNDCDGTGNQCGLSHQPIGSPIGAPSTS